MRAPRTTIPAPVSPTLCTGTRFPTIWASVDLSMVGWMIVWVSEMSSRASRFWNATRLWAPSSFRPSAPSQSFQRPAKLANFTFM